jgi:hypothetical protein
VITTPSLIQSTPATSSTNKQNRDDALLTSRRQHITNKHTQHRALTHVNV